MAVDINTLKTIAAEIAEKHRNAATLPVEAFRGADWNKVESSWLEYLGDMLGVDGVEDEDETYEYEDDDDDDLF